MRILASCMECQKELGFPSFEPIFSDYYEEATAYLECSRGHKSALILQSQKFEILLESAANALLDGYTLEAASSLSAAYERFLEFAIRVLCQKTGADEKNLEDIFKQVSKQSERQVGGFLFLHLITFGSTYNLNKKIPEQRNKVIHQGYIPTPDETIKFGELIYQEIYSITQLLRSSLENEINKVILNDIKSKNKKIPKSMPRATSTGTMFFSLANRDLRSNFREALASYKRSREVIAGSVPYMKLLNKSVLQYIGASKNV